MTESWEGMPTGEGGSDILHLADVCVLECKWRRCMCVYCTYATSKTTSTSSTADEWVRLHIRRSATVYTLR